MIGLRIIRRRALFGSIPFALAFGALAWISTPAGARIFVSVGVPFPGLYAPYPYYPYPPPIYYPPPPVAYYAPPSPGYYPPDAAAAPANITYTDRPAFRNAAGETCREYRAGNGALGTACQDRSGQWRVAN